jgi:hypothetical protein
VVGFDFDNVKSFEDTGEYGKIEIRNAFGIGGKLAEYELTTNTDTCFTHCYAEGTATLYNDAPLFEDLNVKGITGDYITIQSTQFFVKTITIVTEEHKTFDAQCEEVQEKNGSVSNVCTNVQTGTEYIDTEVVTWEPYNYETLEAGDYEWRIEGKKGLDQSVDWIAYSQGIDFEEWAWWDNDFDYRQAISINNSGNDNLLEHYTVEVSGLNTTDGTKFNQTNSNSLAVVCDGVEVDKIFVNESDVGRGKEAEYGTQSGWATSNTTFMFKLPTQIGKQSINDTMCYVYYGKLDYNSTKSNISNIALLYDDFKRSDSETIGNGWVENDTLNGAKIVNEQFQQVDGNNGIAVRELDVGNCTDCQKYEIWARKYWGGTGGDQIYFSFTNEYPSLDDSPGEPGQVGIYTTYSTPASFTINDVNDGTVIKSTTLAYYVAGVNYTEVIRADNDAQSGDYDFYKNGSLIIFDVANNDITTGGNKSYFKLIANRVGDTMDYVMVRRSVDTAPTITLGAEAAASGDYVDNVAIAPDPAYADSTLNCTGQYVYAVGKGNFTFTWTKNGSPQPIYTSGIENINLNDNATSPIVITGTKTKGDTWECSIFANNGTITLNETVTDSITISNSLPDAPVTVSPPEGVQYGKYIGFSCDDGNDKDGDPLNYSFDIRNSSGVWNTVQENTSVDYYFTPEANYTVGFRCRAYDGEGYSNYIAERNYPYDNSIIKNIEAFYIDPVRELGSHLIKLNITLNKYTALNFTANITYLPDIPYSFASYEDGVTPIGNYVDTDNFTRTYITNLTVAVPNINETVSNFTVYLTYGERFYPVNVTQFRIYNCTASNSTNMAVLNLTFLNEYDDSRVNSDLDANFFLWGINGSKSQNSTFTLEVDDVNNTLVCMDGNETYLTYAHLRYSSSNYDPRDYYFINATLNNDTDNLNLYLLNISLATGVEFEVVDGSDRAIPGYYIFIQKYYVSENAYKTVAMGQTDDYGEDYVYLRLYDTWYRFLIQNDTDLVYSSSKRKVSTTNLQFVLQSSPYFNYLGEYSGVTYALDYNNITQIITGTFTSGTGEQITACLNVIKRTASDEETICNTCVTTASGSVNCNYGSENGTYLATFYVHGSPPYILASVEILQNVVSEFTRDIGLEGVVIASITTIAITTTALVTGSAALILILGILSLAISAILGFLNISYGVIVGIVIIGGIIFSLMKK